MFLRRIESEVAVAAERGGAGTWGKTPRQMAMGRPPVGEGHQSIGKGDHGLRMPIEHRGQRGERVGQVFVVRIEWREERAARRLHGRIARGTQTAIAGRDHELDRDRRIGRPALYHRGGIVLRSVVDHDDLARRLGLPRDAVERAGDQMRAVVGRDDDADVHVAGHRQAAFGRCRRSLTKRVMSSTLG